MKVIKRDGRAVDYDRAKIQTAIEKANMEVKVQNRASKEEIKGIITYIEDLNKRRILVEDIQDIIEEKLMELKKYELAKRYIVYRYSRALIRKQNTTDETILGIIRNENKEEYYSQNSMTAAEQRNFIAGEVSKDLTKRLLLPDKIAKADEEGILHFHNKDYFVHPMINSSVINISDMLDNGTVINGKMVETPKSFLVACTVATQIIGVIASNQNGNQAIDMIHFGKYLRKSYKKYKEQIENEYKEKLSMESIEKLAKEKVEVELKNGIQMIQYQINTLEAINGRKSLVTLLLHLEDNDNYLKENKMIIEEILKQRYEGIKNEKGESVTPEFPKLVYVLNELTSLNDGNYSDLTKLAIKCSIKRKSPNYILVRKMRKNAVCLTGDESFLSIVKEDDGCIKFKTNFNQGIVSINLPQIAIIADGNENEFWRLLDERLDLCFEALMCRHYSLVGIQTNISPLHWKYGGLARMQEDEKIDNLLNGEHSTLGLGYLGIYEMTRMIKGVSQLASEGIDFAIKVIKHLNETVKKWKEETNIEFILCGIDSDEISRKFAKIDKERFGTIKDITDKGYYTRKYDINEEASLLERVAIESKFQKISSGENVLYLECNENIKTEEELEEIFKYVSDNNLYASL